jgi:hydrogenase maturation factor HypE
MESGDLIQYSRDNNLHEGYNKIFYKMEELENIRIAKERLEWSEIGTVNYSFDEAIRKTSFEQKDVLQAIEQLNVDFNGLNINKFKFWVDKDLLKIKYAIKLLAV